MCWLRIFAMRGPFSAMRLAQLSSSIPADRASFSSSAAPSPAAQPLRRARGARSSVRRSVSRADCRVASRSASATVLRSCRSSTRSAMVRSRVVAGRPQGMVGSDPRRNWTGRSPSDHQLRSLTHSGSLPDAFPVFSAFPRRTTVLSSPPRGASLTGGGAFQGARRRHARGAGAASAPRSRCQDDHAGDGLTALPEAAGKASLGSSAWIRPAKKLSRRSSNAAATCAPSSPATPWARTSSPTS